MPHWRTKEKIYKCDENDDLLEANLEVNDHLCASRFFIAFPKSFCDLVSTRKIGHLPTFPLTIVKLLYCIMTNQLCKTADCYTQLDSIQT